MKHLIFILLLTSCSPELFITKKYIGRYVSSYENTVVTDNVMLTLTERCTPPDSVYCYIKFIEHRIPGSCFSRYVMYFTYEGTDSLYLIRQNPITGEIY